MVHDMIMVFVESNESFRRYLLSELEFLERERFVHQGCGNPRLVTAFSQRGWSGGVGGDTTLRVSRN